MELSAIAILRVSSLKLSRGSPDRKEKVVMGLVFYRVRPPPLKTENRALLREPGPWKPNKKYFPLGKKAQNRKHLSGKYNGNSKWTSIECCWVCCRSDTIVYENLKLIIY